MKADNLKNRDLVDSILDTALRCVRSGQHFNIEEYCQQYPDLAEELRVMLPALVMLEQPIRESSRANAVSPLPSASLPLELADFQIISEIGRGAMGIVYEAIQRPLGRRVALKVMFREGSSNINLPARFQREAEIAARLHHTNIIPVFEAGETQSHVWYAMQFIQGLNLQQLIAIQGKTHEHRIPSREYVRVDPADETVLQLGSTNEQESPRPWTDGSDEDPEAAVEVQPKIVDAKRSKPFKPLELTPHNTAQIILQVAEGLDFAHQQGILHRDIKPSNIIVDADSRAWIADFGLAKSSEGNGLTATGDVVGTVRYIAPERFHGESDHRSDVYALGLTLFELLEGQPAFRETDRARLISQILDGEVRDFTVKVPRDLATICFKCVERVPADRYATANDLASDLRKFLDGQPISARPLSLPTKVMRWCNRNRLITALLTLIVFGTAWGVVANQWQSWKMQRVTAESNANSQLADRNQLDLLKSVDSFCQMVSENRRLYRNDFRDLRELLLKSADEIGTQIAAQSNVSDRVKFQLASILERLGKMRTNDDSLADSKGYLTRAHDLILELPPETRKEPSVAMELAAIHRQLASVYRRMGVGEPALENVQEAIRILNDILDLATLTNDVIGITQAELARTFSVQGDILFEMRHMNESEAAMMQCIELWEKQLQAEPANRVAGFELAVQWTRIGSLKVGNLKKWREAEKPLDEAMRLYRLAKVQMPEHADLDFWLAQALSRKAKWHYIAKELEEAIVSQRSAIDLLEGQHLIFGRDLALQQELGVSLRLLADYLLAQNPRDPEILTVLDRSAQILAVAVASDPDDLPSFFSLEKTCLTQAELLRRLDQPTAALEKVDLAIQTLKALLETDRAVAQATEERYFASVIRAEILTELARTDEALAEWDVALKFASKPFVDIARMDRNKTIAWAGSLRTATEQAEEILDRLPPDFQQRRHFLVGAACTFAIAAQVVLQEDDNPNSQAESDRYANRAVELLRIYQEGGENVLKVVELHDDFYFLIDRPDFQTLLGPSNRQEKGIP